jgi:transposase-like protein
MAMKYSKEFKDSIIAKLLPPSNVSVLDVAKETGIPKDTLYCWRVKYRNTSASESDQGQQSCNFSSEEKLTIVIETASLNETETSEYCRRKGLYPDQINGWTSVIKQSLTRKAPVSKADRKTARQQEKTIKQLQSELNRKDRALAEAAALLILEKKIQSIWSKPEGEKLTCRRARK